MSWEADPVENDRKRPGGDDEVGCDKQGSFRPERKLDGDRMAVAERTRSIRERLPPPVSFRRSSDFVTGIGDQDSFNHVYHRSALFSSLHIGSQCSDYGPAES